MINESKSCSLNTYKTLSSQGFQLLYILALLMRGVVRQVGHEQDALPGAGSAGCMRYKCRECRAGCTRQSILSGVAYVFKVSTRT